METIGIYEAKTNLSKIMERVELGESFAITRHGKVIADIVPRSDEQQPRPSRLQQALADIERFHQTHEMPKVTLEEILQGRHEGHKY